MKRGDFLKILATLPLLSHMELQSLHKFAATLSATNTMPLVFFGHGSPMNALEQNEFSLQWQQTGKSLPRPQAILCISAHWETKGTFVTTMKNPPTIHDFGGFPDALFQVQYPAPGSPELAHTTQEIITATEVFADEKWGLDHGTWSVLKHVYPNADIPVVQLSLDYTKGPEYHYALAKELSALRNKGVLIIGSGNMVHNLGRIDWQHPDTGYEWANEANETFKKWILDDDHQALIDYKKQGTPFLLSVPTPEHYLPLLYILGLKQKNERISFFNDKTVMGSLSMTSVKIEKI